MNIKYRAIKLENVTGTFIEACWLARLATYKLYVAVGFKEYIKIYNREARKLQTFRREFYL